MSETIAVIGLGMLGCSLSASLKGSCRRLGWGRRPEAREWAKGHDIIDESCNTVEEALEKADIAVLCLPIPVIVEFLKKYSPLMKNTLITDIGSVKGNIARAARENKIRYVGGHPMAGTEKSGPEAFVPGIYEGASVFVVPPRCAAEEDILRVENMWCLVKANPIRIPAKAHDLLVAHTSHVPHVVSAALALSVLDAKGELKKRRFAGCASGFRDTVRVAASSPKMWREILASNKEAVLEALASFEVRYARLKEMIALNDFDSFEKEFGHGKELVEEWRATLKIRK